MASGNAPFYRRAVTHCGEESGLAGDVGGVVLEWECGFKRGMQQLALPVPATAVSVGVPTEVHIHLTGSPSRETDYLLAYAAAPRGGFVASVVGPADLAAGATTCRPREG